MARRWRTFSRLQSTPESLAFRRGLFKSERGPYCERIRFQGSLDVHDQRPIDSMLTLTAASSDAHTRSGVPSLQRKIAFLLRQLRQRWRVWLLRRRPASLPLTGYDAGQPMPLIDRLSDEQLVELNRMLDWNSFVVDGHGRRFGGAAWLRTADKSERIPNKRTQLMHEAFNLD